jgi:Peptidase_C39 like family
MKLSPAAVFLIVAQVAGGSARAGVADLVILTNMTAFTRSGGNEGSGEVWVSSELRSRTPWNELVVSWNVVGGAMIDVEASPVGNVRGVHWFNLGRWSLAGPRTSPPRQVDDVGEVDTDTLRVKTGAAGARLRITVTGGSRDSVKLLALAFSDTMRRAPSGAPVRSAWGVVQEPPRRSQASYPEGITKWCSAASTSMLLGYWANRTGATDEDRAVPEVAAAVYDDAWRGTGNWPFNTALIGSNPHLRACVARFNNLADLERWTGSGFPAAASLSYAVLQGKSAPEPGDGHLVVVCGFDREGRVVINDPGVRLERVRRVFPRSAFDAAWGNSHRTVYLAWPMESPPPVLFIPAFEASPSRR